MELVYIFDLKSKAQKGLRVQVSPRPPIKKYAPLAQPVEHSAYNRKVPRSSRGGRTNFCDPITQMDRALVF